MTPPRAVKRPGLLLLFPRPIVFAATAAVAEVAAEPAAVAATAATATEGLPPLR